MHFLLHWRITHTNYFFLFMLSFRFYAVLTRQLGLYSFFLRVASLNFLQPKKKLISLPNCKRTRQNKKTGAQNIALYLFLLLFVVIQISKGWTNFQIQILYGQKHKKKHENLTIRAHTQFQTVHLAARLETDYFLRFWNRNFIIYCNNRFTAAYTLLLLHAHTHTHGFSASDALSTYVSLLCHGTQ